MIVFLAREAFFLRRGHNLAVAHETRSGIMIVSRDAQYVRHLPETDRRRNESLSKQAAVSQSVGPAKTGDRVCRRLCRMSCLRRSSSYWRKEKGRPDMGHPLQSSRQLWQC